MIRPRGGGDGKLIDVVLSDRVLVLGTIQRGPHRLPNEQPHGLQAQGGVALSVKRGAEGGRDVQRNPPSLEGDGVRLRCWPPGQHHSYFTQ